MTGKTVSIVAFVLGALLGMVGVAEAHGKDPFQGIAMAIFGGSLIVASAVLAVGSGWIAPSAARHSPAPGSLAGQFEELARLEATAAAATKAPK